MSNKFSSGDEVTWSSGSGEAEGTVKKKITDSEKVDGKKVKASDDDPRYLVENENTGNVTGHKPETLSSGSSSGSSSGGSSSNSSGNSSGSSGDAFSPGDKVRWNTAQGKTTGTVKKKLTENTSIKDFDVKASEDDPKYLVESEKSGNQAAHKPESLEKA